MNEAFPNSSRRWTVQRADVDNFYGSVFEADFVKLSLNNKSALEILCDKTLSQQLHPNILINNKSVDYYILHKGSTVPPNFKLIDLPCDDGTTIPIVFKVTPSEFNKMIYPQGVLAVETYGDLRLAAVVSLIKAAHLTMFEIFGYSYALSPAGRLIGHDILGEFYLQNHHISQKPKILENAFKFFGEFIHMIRPIQQNIYNLRGTLDDHQILVCRGYSHDAPPWAYIVSIKTGDALHSVMLPVFEHVDAISTFLGFLKNSNESLEVHHYTYDNNLWHVAPNAFPLNWPKKGILLP